jgi:MFS family permease
MRGNATVSYLPVMDTTHSRMPARTDRNATNPALLVIAFVWLAPGVASRNPGLYSDGDGWETPYALFAVALLAASVATTFVIARHTSEPGSPSGRRTAAVALAVLGTVSTVVAWAFPVWAVLLAAGFFALAATGPAHRRRVGWLGGALLAGLALAIVAVNAKLGPADEYNHYSEGQSWGVTVACVLAAAVLVGLARTNEARVPVGSTRA